MTLFAVMVLLQYLQIENLMEKHEKMLLEQKQLIDVSNNTR